MCKNKGSRLEALAKGECPDRVPISLSLSNYAPKLLEISSKEYFFNPPIAFEASLWLKKMFPDDSGINYNIPEGLCWDFGGELKISDGISWPMIKRYPVRTEKDLLSLQIPDPYTAPAATKEFEFAKIRHNAGFRRGSLTFPSPFRQAVQIIGSDNLMRWIIRKPHLVHLACKKVLEYNIKVAQMYIKKFGADYWSVLVTYPMESYGLISPQKFVEFSVPHALELHNKLRNLGINQFMEHPCGDHSHNLWFWRDKLNLKKHTIISVGTEIPIEKIDFYFGENFVIGGNISVIDLINLLPREIYHQCQTLINKMKYRRGGFVLMAACVISTAVPPANITAMIEAVKDFGSY